MRHWSQIATRNWQVKRVRTAGALLAIALGTGAVVWVTACYESVRQTMLDWASGYVGNSHVSIQSPLGKYDVLPQRLVRKLRGLDDVKHVTPLLVQRLPSAAVTREEADAGKSLYVTLPDVDFHGIDLESEHYIRDWEGKLAQGRMLRPDDNNACVLELSIAEEENVGVGDILYVWGSELPEDPPTRLEIVGLVHRRRIARFQKGVALVRMAVLQRITRKSALVNSIDVVLKDPENLRQAARRIHAAIKSDAPNVHVRSAAARMERIRMAQDQQRVVLILLSCMALLTALFIILSTLSMGMIERISQLGLLRCVGMTGRQLAGLVFAEVLPLGVLGIALGIPIGLGLTLLTVWSVPQYVGSFTVSVSGIVLAAVAGLVTTLVAAIMPAIATMTVSPLEATHPRSRRAGFGWLLIAAVVACVLMAVQHYIITQRVQRDMQFVQWAAASVTLLYIVYAAAAPLLVWLVSRLVVPVTSLLVGVKTRLLQDQVGYAVWRSAGICCGLMVGLSLIVGLVVFNASFKSGWQFPKQFPEAYIWSFDQIRGDVSAAAERTPGVGEYTAANAVNVIVEEPAPTEWMNEVFRSVTWFLGVDPDSFFDMLKLEFVENTEESAKELLKQGGHVLIASDFARTRKKGYEIVRDDEGNVVVDNKVRVWLNNRWTTFKVAGVIDSPALDIAAGYFQVSSEATVVAVGSVIGTNRDLREIYGIGGHKLVLMNFDLPTEPPPPDWPPPANSPEGAVLHHKHFDTSIPLDRRWENYREAEVLKEFKWRLDAPTAFYGTARELKDEIDTELTRMTYLLTAVPAVALIVAALGVANLMTANVASRTRQLAILRAVGSTRSMILRMVIGEALVLGMLGSALGLGLGLHLMWNVQTMTIRMWGYDVPFEVPWMTVGLAVGLTTGLCILAGVAPARHASRTNVIDALHVA